MGCERLELVVVDPSLDQLLEAGAERGRLSFEDRICLMVARDAGWGWVTNDRRLHTMRESESVSVMWSLDLLVAFVGVGHLPSDEAIAIGADSHLISPRHITRHILDALEREIEAL